MAVKLNIYSRKLNTKHSQTIMADREKMRPMVKQNDDVVNVEKKEIQTAY